MRAIFLTIALVPTLAQAQVTRQIQCRFLTFGGTNDSVSVIATSDKGAEFSCQITNSELSPKVACVAQDNTIKFLSPDDKKPLATATIPAAVDSALLVFVQIAGKPGATAPAPPTWRVVVIDDSTKNFPDGGAFVANFYSSDIRFIIGEHKGMLHAAGMHGYAMPKERDPFNMSTVVVEFQQGEKWRTASESNLRFLPGMRYLIFAYVDPASGRPRISTYQDIPAPTPAKAKS